MKKVLVLVITVAVLYQLADKNPVLFRQTVEQETSSNDVLQRAYNNKKSNLQVGGSGSVSRILPDDRKGSRHQKFILRLSNGQHILIVHNIDLARRINKLSIGDTVEFFGEYEWNDKGGLIHWTHHDPAGRHVDGWLKHDGSVYQ